VKFRPYRMAMKICLISVLSIAPLLKAQPEAEVTLVVLDFKNNTSRIRYGRLQRTIAELLKTELSRHPEIAVVERTKIDAILSEYALMQAGIVEQNQVQEVGKLVGAAYIITGEINLTSGKLRIDSHLIKVATGQILGEKVVGDNEDKIEPMIKLLANNLIFELTGSGERRQLQKIKQYHPGWALAVTGAMAVTTIILDSNYKANYDRYHGETQLDRFDDYYHRANQSYKLRNAFISLTGAAAITSFVLWRLDRNSGNEILASYQDYHRRTLRAPITAIRVDIDESFFRLSLNFHF